MRDIVKKIPIPMCGVMLGIFALGNLLQSYSEEVRHACGIVGGVMLLLLLLKLILFPQLIKEDMKNPIMASVAGTFSMSLMLLSTYVKSFVGQAAFYLWLFAFLLHIVLIIYFTLRFMIKLDIKKVFASYYIVYVGIVAASITAPAFERTGAGALAFWFGFAALIILLILTTARYIKHMEVPQPAKPLLCIYAAPTSLCVAGYIQSAGAKSYRFLMAMYILASLLYIFALIKAIGYLRLPFYPSYASFTFPFVISAIASKQTMACTAGMGNPIPLLGYVMNIQTVIAVVLVLYTLGRYIGFLAVKK